MNLVCPHCDSERIGTIERAYIWQPASFQLHPDGVLEDAQGQPIDVDWDAYDSDDVGDTETVGYFCRGCQSTWGEINDESGPVPFVHARATA